MPSLLLSNPLAEDDAQRIGLDIRYYAPGEIITVNDFVFATLVRTGYGTPYGSDEDILLIGDGSPTAAVGTDGQWYLDRLNEVLWGPKTGGYWPSNPIRPDRGVSNFKIDAAGHLIVTYSTGTVVDLGRAKFVSRGVWTAGTAYTVDDLVSSDGSMFRVTVAHTAAAPAPTRQAPGANYELWAAKGDQASLTRRVATGSVTLAAADVFAAVDVDSAAAATVTVPTNATVPIPVGGWIEVGRIGAGAVTIAGAAGVTVRAPDGNLTLRAQHSRVRLHQVATDVWALTGDNNDATAQAVAAATSGATANALARRDGNGNAEFGQVVITGSTTGANANNAARKDWVDGQIATRIPTTEKGAANGVATLDAGGKLTVGQVPAIALSDFLGTVASEAAMLALVGQRGDWTTRTDLGADFILIADDPTVVGNWRQITTPGKVTSVDGRTGAVTLTDLYLAATARGAANGVAPLGADSKVPVANLPGIGDDAGGLYVPDVIDPAVPLEVTIVSNWGVTDTLTNLATDPRALAYPTGAGGMGWATDRWFGPGSGAGTHTYVTGATDGPLGIGTYLRKEWTTAPTAVDETGLANSRSANADRLAVTAGDVLTHSGYIRSTKAGQYRCTAIWTNEAGTEITRTHGAWTTVAAGTWTRLSLTATAPTGATRAYLVTGDPNGTNPVWAVGDRLDGTALLVERSNLLHDYFDGTRGGTWTGTANASTSTHEPITYYDDAGAPEAEAGVLIPDPETGSVAVWRPGGAWSNYLDRRVADLIYDNAGLTRAAGVRRYLGELASYPAVGVALNGDYLYHSGLGCLMGRVNGAWRQLSLPRYADAATRDAVPSTLLYTGFRAFQTDRQWELAWTGSAWSIVSGVLPGIRVVKTDTQSIGAAWTPITWPAPATAPLGHSNDMYAAGTNTRLFARVRGRYRVTCGFNGVSHLQIRLNSAGGGGTGSMLAGNYQGAAAYLATSADEVVLDPGDYVEAFAYNGTTVTAGAVNGYTPHFSLSYVGPA